MKNPRAVLLGLCMALAFAGASARELVVAQVGPFSGPLGGNGVANYQGSQACIDEANAAGGVNGQPLRLIGEDDQYKPAETVRKLKEVASREQPVAFLNLLGSANVKAVLEENVLDALRIPVVGITPGADALRNPGSPWLFHIHANDTSQLKRILQHLATLGLRRIAVVYQDIPFGHGGMKFIEGLAPSLQMTIAGRVPVASAADELRAEAEKLRATNAQAYIMVLVPNSGSSLVRDVRRLGDATPIYGMSYVPVHGILEKVGQAKALGVGLAQVTPNTFSSSTGLSRQFRAAMARHAHAGTASTQLHLTGYLSCRVLVEALKLTPSPITSLKLQVALRRLRADFGGYVVDFSGGNEGSRYVDIGVVTRDGRLLY